MSTTGGERSRRQRLLRAFRVDSSVALLRAIEAHGRGFPFATNLSLISVPIGLMAVIMGPRVSRAFDIVFNRPEPIYIWGVVLLLGGCNVAFGIGVARPSQERAGLYVLATAYTFYGVSVILGLGVNGLVTGPVFLILALSCVQRARVILRASRIINAYVAAHKDDPASASETAPGEAALRGEMAPFVEKKANSGD